MAQYKDQHGQPVPALRQGANREKAINTLMGICMGITADRRLNEQEVVYLSTWMSQTRELTYGDPDMFDITCQLKEVLDDGKATQDELDDLQDMLSSILEYRPTRFDSKDVVLQHLTGIVHGMVADSHLNNDEIHALNDWLHEHVDLESSWPFNRIIQRVRSVLADGVITEEERADLMAVMISLNGRAIEDIGTVGGQSTTIFIEEVSTGDLAFEGKTFVLTGTFAYGTRSRCCQEIERRGGQIAGAVSKKVHYLVVGGTSSRDWINESYGTKIKRAMELRDAGHQIFLVDEERWASFL